MAKVLVLFAHPALEKSRVHKRMISHLKHLDGIYLHDLYEAYPDFDIDVKKEQQLLLQHDIIVWQHPFYWYNSPALIKQWQDLVLEHGWAYGSGGNMLENKKILNAISCGGPRIAYSKEGRNRFTIRELLSPFDQTAFLCKMKYLPPFVVHGTHRLTMGEIEMCAIQYEQLIISLVNDSIKEEDLQKAEYINDLFPIPEHIQS